MPTSGCFLALALLLAVVPAPCIAATARVGLCQPVVLADVNSRSGESLGVVGAVAEVVSLEHGRPEPNAATKVELIRPPTHGKFIVIAPPQAGEWPDYRYVGDVGYEGADSFDLAVHLASGRVDAVYYTQVVRGDVAAARHCQKRYGKNTWRMQ